jgi:GNAT superfamily N-acetyltransferase
MNLVLRAGRANEAQICGSICYEAFRSIAVQHNFPPDFPVPEAAVELLAQLLSREDIYSVIAEVDGRIVGSNFLWENGDIAGVGPITVEPAVQNMAVGKRLMEDVLQRAQYRGIAQIRLVQAAYHNRSLSVYTKLGFEVREPLAVLQGPAIARTIPGHDVRLAIEGDLAACNELCRKVHGHDRGSEIVRAILDGTATVVEHDGHIAGYSTLVGFFGHAVGESNEDLKALISTATSFPGPGFLLPIRNSELLRWCLKNELRLVQPMTLMSIGQYKTPAGAYLPSIVY